MVLLKDIDEFERKAKEMLSEHPKETRLSTKYKRAGPVFTLKVTDGRACYRLKIVKDQMVKQAQKVIASLMHMMTSSELVGRQA